MNPELIAYILGFIGVAISWSIGWVAGYKIGHDTGYRRGKSVRYASK
jgi:hypothetical protein